MLANRFTNQFQLVYMCRQFNRSNRFIPAIFRKPWTERNRNRFAKENPLTESQLLLIRHHTEKAAKSNEWCEALNLSVKSCGFPYDYLSQKWNETSVVLWTKNKGSNKCKFFHVLCFPVLTSPLLQYQRFITLSVECVTCNCNTSPFHESQMS